MSPTACRASSPSATWVQSSTASRRPRLPSRLILSSSEPPVMNFCAMYGTPSCSPRSMTGTTFGCATRAAAPASRSKRRRNTSSRASCAFTTFRATISPSGATARYTRPIPPSPSIACTLYGPTNSPSCGSAAARSASSSFIPGTSSGGRRWDAVDAGRARQRLERARVDARRLAQHGPRTGLRLGGRGEHGQRLERRRHRPLRAPELRGRLDIGEGHNRQHHDLGEGGDDPQQPEVPDGLADRDVVEPPGLVVEDAREHEQQPELRQRQHTARPRWLPLEQPRVDRRVEERGEQVVAADEQEPVPVAGHEREDQADDRRADEGRRSGVDSAYDGGAHRGFLYASCFVLRIWLIAFDALPASESCRLSFDGNDRYLRFSARAQSATKRRASYFRPAIVSAFGTTVFEISPIAQRRESGLSSGGTPQFVFSRIRSW